MVVNIAMEARADTLEKDGMRSELSDDGLSDGELGRS